LLGARIGHGVHIDSKDIDCFDLLTIGSSSSVGKATNIRSYEIRHGKIIFEKTTIGRNVSIGASCVVSPGTIMENDSCLEPLSHLISGTIYEGQTFTGSPAVKKEKKAAKLTDIYHASLPTTILFYIGIILASSFSSFFGFFIAVPFFYGFFQLAYEFNTFGLGWWWPVLLNFPGALFGVLFFCFSLVFFKWAIIGKMKPLTAPLKSFQYIKHWLWDKMWTTTLTVLHTMFATLYLTPLLKALGSKLGENTEVSFFWPMNCTYY
jgi:non-ribosomal peptide synthetase-like protein